MSAKIFISYRRQDSEGYAGRIHDRLAEVFGSEHLFMDVDNIRLGVNFPKMLREQVERSEVLLALIGPNWLDVRDDDGKRRLDDPNDWVRVEIGTALQCEISIIPVLLQGAKVPKPRQLPKDLQNLGNWSGLEVRHPSFRTDTDRLVKELKEKLFPAKGQLVTPAPRGAVAVALEAKWRSEGRIKVDPKIIHGAPDGWFMPCAGKVEWFQDHENAPEMVVVPAGELMMGSSEGEPERFDSEGPPHQVKLARPFGVGRHAVTRGQFAAFINNTTYRMEGGATVWTGNEWKRDSEGSWRDPGFRQDDNHPVVCVNWDDARAYAAWLSQITGQTYRLLSEAEWEYVARAGTATPFWWGSSITPAQANYDGNFVYKGGGVKGEYRKATMPVGDFEANPWGLYNVHGNAWEWCEDIWHDNYIGAPADGSAWLRGGDSSRRVLRGGSWSNRPRNLRSAGRSRYATGGRVGDVGFRLGRTLSARAGTITVAPAAH